MKKNKIEFLLLFFFIPTLVYMQPIFEGTFTNKYTEVMHDNGINWDELSTISSNRNIFEVKNLNFLGFSLGGFGINFNTQNYPLNIFGKIILKNNLYAYFDSNLKYGFNFSGVGYENKWLIIQIGKAIEQWGAGNDINLALSNNAKPYEYIMLFSDYGNIRVKYIHGRLKTNGIDYNRYINARGVEWTNKKSLIIGLTETIVYSGKNRSLDFGYLNPLSTHLEIELNNRLNAIGDSSSNAVWQLHVDWFANKKSRFSFNYLIDEFVFDKNIEIGKEHGKAFSLKHVSHFKPLNLYFSYVYVSTPTFRHGNGTNNFVNGDAPLGWEYGSDGTERSIGLMYLNKKKNLIYDFSYNEIEIGDESIIMRPYDSYSDYLKGKFPSGNLTKIKVIENEVYFKLRSNITVGQKGKYFIKNKSEKLYFSLIISLSF